MFSTRQKNQIFKASHRIERGAKYGDPEAGFGAKQGCVAEAATAKQENCKTVLGLT